MFPHAFTGEVPSTNAIRVRRRGANLLMRAAIERGEARPDRAPAARADVALDRDAALRKNEIRAGAAALVPLRAVLIMGGRLRQFLLLLRLVLLGLGSRGATGRGGGGNAHGFDKGPPR